MGPELRDLTHSHLWNRYQAHRRAGCHLLSKGARSIPRAGTTSRLHLLPEGRMQVQGPHKGHLSFKRAELRGTSMQQYLLTPPPPQSQLSNQLLLFNLKLEWTLGSLVYILEFLTCGFIVKKGI